MGRGRLLMAKDGSRPQYGRKRHVRPDGYVRVWVPGHPAANADGYAQEHRWMLHEAGIPVPDGWHVHHLNGDRADNRLDNLAVMSAAAHTREHLRAAGEVVNQYGSWPLMSPEEKLEKSRARCREYMRIRNGFYSRYPDAEPAFLPLYERHFGAAA
ncbi:MAG TPA: HNH endonuclease signature motif containing protein [Gaiellaceae bacterium]|nr:HNH endonuclease signature motif containing protein [Gaiellaceae bacterium]